jgi:hypothetical protein
LNCDMSSVNVVTVQNGGSCCVGTLSMMTVTQSPRKKPTLSFASCSSSSTAVFETMCQLYLVGSRFHDGKNNGGQVHAAPLLAEGFFECVRPFC